MAVTSRETLIDYAKRRLGEPVLEVNVDDDQVSDRVDEALQYWQQYHSDASYRCYVSHQITQTDIDNKYIDVPSNILYLTRLFAINTTGSTSVNFFDIKYQMMLNDIADMHNYVGDLAYYEQMQSYLSLLDMKLNGVPQTEFVQKQNRLYIFGEFENDDIKKDDYIVYEAYKLISESGYSEVWNDMWLKQYTTALIKQQWGMNLIKFEGMQLPGGVILNGRQLFDDATAEIEELREQIRMVYETPPGFFVG